MTTSLMPELPELLKRTILPAAFYQSGDVVQISRDLLGKALVTEIGGKRTAGIIVETEAYKAPEDKASHAYGLRKTLRTQTMFMEGGTAYVYLCYGIHHLFNVVTGPEGLPHAVLIRAIEPAEGIDYMLERRRMSRALPNVSAGPGLLSQALGLNRQHDAQSLIDPSGEVRIEDWGIGVPEEMILASPRVGVGYAQECAAWPWRFRVRHNIWTSPAK